MDKRELFGRHIWNIFALWLLRACVSAYLTPGNPCRVEIAEHHSLLTCFETHFFENVFWPNLYLYVNLDIQWLNVT